ncbi:16S rRNA (cytosine(1402)-N(4))-methyltransferase RsmH [Natronogracilivirga saccharolytica]|uniref:Ribosomal RNA small subunit methyltransferase H n=1 Tax=Natronogracilivirga saccharolytica TaxID=2812953 RepID=A0A8J7UXJ7_9BACT|nr:16S rRNA (cytosine(1402)-N(4))-methyltransferase RsmH [Natronogracilivirga saccharolytica]MBP3193404.1 16S rRNA (cytosine(1402)-N(4))-methyltransferase RsmH [Natronogracilivirga saccharolytica]
MTDVSYHKPVLLNEAIQYLVTDPNGVYVDGTLGGGGHSARILQELSGDGHLYACDQDEDALAYAGERFQDEERMTIIRGNFGYIDTLLPKRVHGRISGMLLDLGVSSYQIDVPERGFSFQKDGPLDMRMGRLQASTASEIVNTYEYEDLRNLLYEYGEERHSGRIAREVIRSRPLETTAELRDVVASVVPDRFLNKSLARIFQALRIAVNSELRMLKQVLEKGTALLADDGRFVVITYHSLEDRLCKNYFRTGNFEGRPVKDFYGNDIRPLSVVNKKVISPSEKEQAENPRARSAKLRVARKIPASGAAGETGESASGKRSETKKGGSV